MIFYKNMLKILLVYLCCSTELTKAKTLNMPNKRELWVYLNALERMINFCDSTKRMMTEKTFVGLFFVNVNLQAIIQNKGQFLPKRLLDKLNALLKKGTLITKHFKKMLSRYAQDSVIFVPSLYSNESHWAHRIQDYRFLIHEDKKVKKQRFEKKYRKWYKYVARKEKKTEIKRPTKPGVCMVTLAQNPEKYFDGVVAQCSIDKICYEVILNGLDFGYPLSFRLFLLLLARLGRGCSIFISVFDEDLAKRFCVAAYAESEQIMLHYSSEQNGLMFEEMSLCSLNGHPEFLQTPWLSEILKIQAPNGCFLDTHAKRELNLGGRYNKRFVQEFQRQKGDDLKGVCEAEVTALAASVFAGAVRYIVSFHF